MKKLLYLLLLISLSPSASSETSIGTGLGIPYGMLGIGLSHTASEKVDLTVGLGTTVVDGSAYSIGGRYYPKDSDSGLRFSALYGTNAIIVRDDICPSCVFSEYEAFEGLTFGVGWGPRASQTGWNIDLMIIATSKAYARDEELRSQGFQSYADGTRVALAAGYHWAL